MKKVLVVDDSALMRRAVSDIIKKVDEYILVYTANDGLEGLELIKSNKDIIAVFCDINMPKMNGTELLETVKGLGINVPFIMISSRQDTLDTMVALEHGCLDFIKKPENIFDTGNEAYIRNISNALKMANEVCGKSIAVEKKQVIKKASDGTHRAKSTASKGKNKLVALVCSTGGPRALQHVIPKLPSDLPVPMVIVQHMPAGFTATMAERLNSISAVTVKEAEDDEVLKKGVVYVSRGGLHMQIASGRIHYDDSPPIVGLKPCGNIMYESLMKSDYDEIVCVVLTGMGADGTKGIKKLAETNSIYVIAQNEVSSTVYGMPRAIYESGLTDCVCDLDNIANEIVKKVGV